MLIASMFYTLKMCIVQAILNFHFKLNYINQIEVTRVGMTDSKINHVLQNKRKFVVTMMLRYLEVSVLTITYPQKVG